MNLRSEFVKFLPRRMLHLGPEFEVFSDYVPCQIELFLHDVGDLINCARTKNTAVLVTLPKIMGGSSSASSASSASWELITRDRNTFKQ